jgi:hypothetical protein
MTSLMLSPCRRIALGLVDKWRKDLEVSYERLSCEMGFWNVEGS